MDLSYSKNFALYFDRLRYEKGMTQEEFVDQIISMRQFRRYLNGSSYMPHDVITKFSERLGYRPQHMILEFESEKIQETKKVNVFYNLVANRGYKEAYQMMEDFPLDSVIETYNKFFYQHATHYLFYRTGKITEEELLDQTLTLIDYPNILQRSSLSSIEMVALSSLVGISCFKEPDRVAERLIVFSDNPNRIYSGQSEHMQTLVLYRLAEYYGRNERYKEVINVCNRAISFNKEFRSYYLLDFLYYFNALAFYRLGQMEAFEESLFRVYATLQADGLSLRYQRLHDLVKGDWGIFLHDFAQDYMAKHPPVKEEK
ncbi:MAG: hypothetical protein RBQ71_03625 [Acholeplasmataceae bacterium]|jgi:transcriptional regulator with XRE-family HTH domain|nr:hypothetical protein [Acholeplasmataceae bacterium]